MSVEIPFNQLDIDKREQRIKQSLEEFQSLINERFDEQKLSKINEALALMLKIHLPQKDRANGSPYAIHPLEVAKKILEINENATVEQVVSALLHDSIEDVPEILFAQRAQRKFPDRNYKLVINEETKEKYLNILRDWAFKEILHNFGPIVEHHLHNLTNHDFDSLVEELPDLSTEEKIDFKNQAYAAHIEEIIEDPELCLLKYADFSKNINIKDLPLAGEKYFKLKRKYSSAIPIFIDKIKTIDQNHPLYNKKDLIVAELEEAYRTEYKN